MKDISTSVCFTGSRPQKMWGYNKESYIPFLSKLEELVYVLYNHGYDTFITGGAQGFDQLMFWAINNVKNKKVLAIKNIVYVPFKGQESKWAETGIFSQEEYKSMLNTADEVLYLREVDLSNKYDVINALHARNHDMCDNASLVVGLCPDTRYRVTENSGTAECLRYAEKTMKPMWLLDRDTFKITKLTPKMEV